VGIFNRRSDDPPHFARIADIGVAWRAATWSIYGHAPTMRRWEGIGSGFGGSSRAAVTRHALRAIDALPKVDRRAPAAKNGGSRLCKTAEVFGR